MRVRQRRNRPAGPRHDLRRGDGAAVGVGPCPVPRPGSRRRTTPSSPAYAAGRRSPSPPACSPARDVFPGLGSSRLDSPRRPRRRRQPLRHRLPRNDLGRRCSAAKATTSSPAAPPKTRSSTGPETTCVSAGGGDDAVPNNGGADDLDAGAGEDLFISNAVCDGDPLDGGADRDNANWAQLRLGGRDRPGDARRRPGRRRRRSRAARAATLTLAQRDRGHRGDEPRRHHGRRRRRQPAARPARPRHLPRRRRQRPRSSPTPERRPDPDPTIDCGAGFDTALIDRPENGPDAAPVGCESVEERDPNSFRPPDTPPAARSAAAASPRRRCCPQARDRTAAGDADRPPAGQGRDHPAAGAARSSSPSPPTSPAPASAAGSTASRSPPAARRAPTRSALGRHTFRVFAIDAAGNRDRSPALFAFRVRRRASGRWSRSRPRRGRTRPAPRPRPAPASATGVITQLGDAVARLDPEDLGRVGVEQQDPDLAAVAGVDQARGC